MSASPLRRNNIGVEEDHESPRTQVCVKKAVRAFACLGWGFFIQLASGNYCGLDPVEGAVYKRHTGPLFRQHQLHVSYVTLAEGSLAVAKVVLPHAQEPLVES